MAVVARILGLSLLAGAPCAVLGYSFLRPASDAAGVSLILACVGAIIGAIAGAAREIVTALRQRPPS